MAALTQWMNDRPPGTAEGWESWIPGWGSTKNALAYFADGRWGWGAFHAVMAISDAFLLKSIVTGAGKAIIGGAGGLLSKLGTKALKLPVYDDLARGVLGVTTSDGRVILNRGLSAEVRAKTLRHEAVHVFFTPKSGPLVGMRQELEV